VPAARRPRSAPGAGAGLLTCVLAVAWLGAGCTTVRVTPTQRSGVEQRLIVRSIERAVADLDVGPLADLPVALELYALTADQDFARQYTRSLLEARGVRIVSGDQASRRLRVFASPLAVDTAETLVGVPSVEIPVLGVPIPEIALFKWERAQGTVDVQIYAYDAAGRFLARLPDGHGGARWNRYTILIFISFVVTDVDEPVEEAPPPE
jgi:hypothetical protein